MIILDLPYPPTINHYYGRTRSGRVFIKAGGKAYRSQVIALLSNYKGITGKVSMSVDIYPPDRRKRDVDNILKALCDALTHAGIYEDDSQIYKLLITKHEKSDKKGVKVVISSFT